MKTDLNMFVFDIEIFLSDVRGPRYLHLKMVYNFVAHPVIYYNKTSVESVPLEKTFDFILSPLWIWSSLGIRLGGGRI